MRDARPLAVFLLTILFALGLVLSFALHRVGELRRSDSPETAGERPERVVCAVPNIVEIVYALGQGDRVVAVSDFATYPPEAMEKPKMGGYINPNLERIIALEPDLVIAVGLWEKLARLCEEKNIPLLRTEIETLDSLYEGIRSIGEAMGCPGAASELTAEIRAGLDAVRERARTQPGRPDVFLCLSREEGEITQLSTVGSNTFLSELITIAGGRNIFGDLPDRYAQVSREALIQRQPDVVIELRPEDIHQRRAPADILSDWNALPVLPAVANGRVRLVTEDYIKIPGPRIVQSAERLFQILHGPGRSRERTHPN